MRRKGSKCCKKKVRPVRYTYRNGGLGRGTRALVHKGEMIIKSPFRSP